MCVDWNVYVVCLFDVGKCVQDVGIVFGWYNYYWEFMFLVDGMLLMNILLENVLDIEWEMDVVWVICGGYDLM